uniref:Uncharacterized protein n=1 Tax=Trichuris muris TaxID=70415 RepID=A0A5S6Q740_TRIMR
MQRSLGRFGTHDGSRLGSQAPCLDVSSGRQRRMSDCSFSGNETLLSRKTRHFARRAPIARFSSSLRVAPREGSSGAADDALRKGRSADCRREWPNVKPTYPRGSLPGGRVQEAPTPLRLGPERPARSTPHRPIPKSASPFNPLRWRNWQSVERNDGGCQGAQSKLPRIRDGKSCFQRIRSEVACNCDGYERTSNASPLRVTFSAAHRLRSVPACKARNNIYILVYLQARPLPNVRVPLVACLAAIGPCVGQSLFRGPPEYAMPIADRPSKGSFWSAAATEPQKRRCHPYRDEPSPQADGQSAESIFDQRNARLSEELPKWL